MRLAACREVQFDRFSFNAARKMLLRDGQPVQLGQRAMDILAILLDRAGEVVSKTELLEQAWPGLHVEETNLRTQISSLRRALDDVAIPSRVVMNVAGRGYCLVAPVREVAGSADNATASPPPVLPSRIASIVGRQAEIEAVVAQVVSRRFVSIVGAGGIGKTTVALAAAQSLAERFALPTYLVDLGVLTQDALAVERVAAALGVPSRFSRDPASLARALRDQRALIVLDCCEMVIDASAVIAETILTLAPEVWILATSREPLRAEGEWTYRLASLETPADTAGLSAAAALAFPAIQLFVERAAAVQDRFFLTDEAVPTVAGICRQLEGIPLAIEFAAAQVRHLGLTELAARLGDRFTLLMKGRRTALPRHQTLRATLDWSYGLLSPAERTVLHRLAVFRGAFTRDAAIAVTTGGVITSADAAELLGNLQDKSMLLVDGQEAERHYRCPDTTRSYLMDATAEGFGPAAQAHAAYFLRLMENAKDAWEGTLPPAARQAMGRHASNVHAALEWALGPSGDAAMGVRLTIAAVPLWLYFSLVEEGRSHIHMALAALGPGANHDPRSGMQLFAALGSLCLLVSNDEQETAWRSCLDLADRLGDTEHTLRALGGLATCAQVRDHSEALSHATRYRDVAMAAGLCHETERGERIIANLLYILGEQDASRRQIEGVVARYVRPPDRRHLAQRPFDEEVMAKCTLAWVRWLQDRPEDALRIANEGVALAQDIDHELSLFYVSAYCACPIATVCGSLDHAPLARDLMAGTLSRRPPFALWNTCYVGIEMARRGEVEAGIARLRQGLGAMTPGSFGVRFPVLRLGLGECLLTAGRPEEALNEIDAALAAARARHEKWCEPEFMRLRALSMWAAGPAGAVAQAAAELRNSIALARRQSAWAWERRSAVSLRELLRADGDSDEDQRLGNAFATVGQVEALDGQR